MKYRKNVKLSLRDNQNKNLMGKNCKINRVHQDMFFD